MDVDRQTNNPEERINERRSLSSNHLCGSQSRKISIGVLVGSVSKTETKDIKEAMTRIAENETSKENCVKDCEGHTPLVKKNVTVMQKDTSPWVSTRSINPEKPSSAAVHDTEHTTSFQATDKPRCRSKLLEKASAAHSLKFFAGKTGLEYDECRQKNFSKATHSVGTGKVDNSEHVENLVFSTERGVTPEKEQVQDKDMNTERGGHETLRMKLWEILGNVSSPNKHHPSSQSVESHPDQKRDEKHSPIIEMRNPNSDTIESDSDTNTFRRPITRSLTRKKASTKNYHNKKEATKSSCHRKDIPQKRTFSFKRDWSGTLYSNDGSLPSKRSKIERKSSGVETHQDHKYEDAEERQQSENKSRSIPAVQKSTVHKNEVSIAKSSNDRRNDLFVEPKIGTYKNISLESPLNVMTDQGKDVEQPVYVEISNLKDQQANIADSLFKNTRNSVHDRSTSAFEIKSTGCLPRSKQGKLCNQSSAEKIFNTKGIRSFKSLSSSKSTDCKPNVQVELSNDGCELNGSPLMKPSYIMEEESENRMSKSSTDATDSENSEDDSHMKGCRESEQLSPEISFAEKFLHGSDTSFGKDKNVKVTGYSPEGIQNNGELQTYLEQNHEDGLARAVALFTVALGRVKTKLKSMSSKKSAEILRAAAEEIFFLLQNAESRIETDVGKLTNFSQSTRKWMEARIQEQREQLLGIYRKFKEEVDRHLQDYGGVIGDLEEHEIELKRTVERQRAAQRKILSQVEQEIKVQLDDAESRVMAVQELAKEKMLQLKLVVAESVQHGAFG
ncbi:hypothetical protein CDL12_07207 [Handroanthus impetiginosus]|uniref:Meiosis-specific protein ASY3-like coiled-coil domain-containing protein n=1 Tax=Handroanthus impetiginosus TaxID=429701 RepID=A0A2G9HS39_9LAMI|nr:hypothetical protein CDL12_07207 [Handroanthus impetiginosus]